MEIDESDSDECSSRDDFDENDIILDGDESVDYLDDNEDFQSQETLNQEVDGFANTDNPDWISNELLIESKKQVKIAIENKNLNILKEFVNNN